MVSRLCKKVGERLLQNGASPFFCSIRKKFESISGDGVRNILERSSHEQLYAMGGRYFDLYTRQHGLETNLFLAPGEGDTVEAVAG